MPFGFFLSYLGSHRLALGSQMLRKAGLILWCPMGFWVKSVPPPQKLFRICYSSGSFSNPFWASNCHILTATADGGARQDTQVCWTETEVGLLVIFRFDCETPEGNDT